MTTPPASRSSVSANSASTRRVTSRRHRRLRQLQPVDGSSSSSHRDRIIKKLSNLPLVPFCHHQQVSLECDRSTTAWDLWGSVGNFPTHAQTLTMIAFKAIRRSPFLVLIWCRRPSSPISYDPALISLARAAQRNSFPMHHRCDRWHRSAWAPPTEDAWWSERCQTRRRSC